MADIEITDTKSRIQYTATIGQTNFTFPFAIFDDSDLTVYLTPAGQTFDPIIDFLTLNVNYTVSITAPPLEGGFIDLLVGAGVGDTIVIQRTVPYDQSVGFAPGGTFLASTINFVIDKLTILDQQTRDRLIQTGLYYETGEKLSASGGDNILPVLPANTGTGNPIWTKNSAGNLIGGVCSETETCSTLRVELLSQTVGAPGTDDVGYFNLSSGGRTLTTEVREINTDITTIEGQITTLTGDFQAFYPRAYIDGLIIENETGDTEHDIKIKVGECKDSTNVKKLFLTSALIKAIDSNWAAGSNMGGFPTGIVLTADTWYHFFIIAKTDGTTDAGYDSSLTATNLLADATGYTLFRRVGSVLTDVSANIIQFIQNGDRFRWLVPQFLSQSADIAAALITLISPLGLALEVQCIINAETVGVTDDAELVLFSPAVTQPAAFQIEVVAQAVSTWAGSSEINVTTDTLSQVKIAAGVDGTGATIDVLSYLDHRGKE